MNEQTVYFLQALYDELTDRERKNGRLSGIDEAKTKLCKIGKLAAIDEMNRYLTGFLRNDTIIVSAKARFLKERALKIMTEINETKYPNELQSLASEAHKIIGEVQALMIITLRAMTDSSFIKRSNIHFIVKQLVPSATQKIRYNCLLIYYRNFILTGGKSVNKLPKSNDIKDWLNYYINNLSVETNCMTDEETDGRWSYVRKKFHLHPNLSIELFVNVLPDNSVFTISPGKAAVKTENGGALKISGRGYLTNLKTDDYELMCGGKYISHIKKMENYSFLKGISENPNVNLNYILSNDKYLISPSEYFRIINRYIISRTLGDRVRYGNCIFCGSPLKNGKCGACGDF